ncbi:MAG TPA: hypothetical protein VJU83_08035 [Burkholderiales bacterium]|nr:hypothetical protein [Burkholderiales bacterium]
MAEPRTQAKHQVPVQGSTGIEDEIHEETRNTKFRQPNDRDEAPDGGQTGTDRDTDQLQREIPQAHADIERGLVDTDRRGVPSDVPSRKGNEAP